MKDIYGNEEMGTDFYTPMGVMSFIQVDYQQRFREGSDLFLYIDKEKGGLTLPDGKIYHSLERILWHKEFGITPRYENYKVVYQKTPRTVIITDLFFEAYVQGVMGAPELDEVTLRENHAKVKEYRTKYRETLAKIEETNELGQSLKNSKTGWSPFPKIKSKIR